MWIDHLKSSEADVSRVSPWSEQRANAWNVSFRILLQWPIHIINPVDKTNLSFILPTDAAPLVSFRSLPLYSSVSYTLSLLSEKKCYRWNCFKLSSTCKELLAVTEMYMYIIYLKFDTNHGIKYFIHVHADIELFKNELEFPWLREAIAIYMIIMSSSLVETLCHSFCSRILY